MSSASLAERPPAKQQQQPAAATAILALALLLGLQPVTTDIYLPALPALRAELGAGMGAAQLTLSALMMAFGLGQLALGPVADRWGRRPVLLAGLALYVLAALGGALADRIAALITWRALQGLGLAAAVVCARAMLRDWFEPRQGAQVMARALTGLGLIAMLSPGLGGLLAGTLGWRATLLATALCAAATLALIALRVPESLARPNPQALRPGPLLRIWGQVARHPVFIAYALLTALAYATLYSFLAGSSFVFIGQLGLSRQAYGLLLGTGAAVYVAGTLACRRMLARHGLAATVRRGAGFTLAGSLLMGGLALAGHASLWSLLIPHCISIFGHGILQPCGQAGAVAPFPRQAGAAAALSGFLIALAAFAVGAWLGLVLRSGAGVLPLALSVAGCGLMTVTVAWTLVQRCRLP